MFEILFRNEERQIRGKGQFLNCYFNLIAYSLLLTKKSQEYYQHTIYMRFCSVEERQNTDLVFEGVAGLEVLVPGEDGLPGLDDNRLVDLEVGGALHVRYDLDLLVVFREHRSQARLDLIREKRNKIGCTNEW